MIVNFVSVIFSDIVCVPCAHQEGPQISTDRITHWHIGQLQDIYSHLERHSKSFSPLANNLIPPKFQNKQKIITTLECMCFFFFFNTKSTCRVRHHIEMEILLCCTGVRLPEGQASWSLRVTACAKSCSLCWPQWRQIIPNTLTLL